VGTARVHHVERTQGSSGYNFRKLMRLWVSMLVNVSILPLRLMTLAGMITSALGFLAVIEVVLEHMLHKTPTGWSSLMAAMLLLSGTQLLLFASRVDYAGRIFLAIAKKRKRAGADQGRPIPSHRSPHRSSLLST